MNGGNWILCERLPRWSAALRLALARLAPQRQPRRFQETRSLGELMTHLAARPESFVLIEVHRANFAGVLELLAEAAPRFTSARFAALLDGTLESQRQDCRSTRSNGRAEAIDALAEAGADAFAASPRELREIYDLAGQYARLLAARCSTDDNRPFADWAWSLLPWQDEPQRIR
jgi:hypothetical protein